MVTASEVRWSTAEATAPATEPVTLAEAKAAIQVEVTDDDTVITNLIKSARAYIEALTGRQLVTATYDLFLEKFPKEIIVPLPPLQSVTSLKYVDTAGVEQTLASSDYQVDTNDTPGRIKPEPTASWPSIETGRYNAVTVRFVAGFGAAAAVPEHLKSAMYLLIGHWYEHPEADAMRVSKPIAFGVESLVNIDLGYAVA